MTFEPQFQAKFIEPVATNVLAAVKTNQRAAFEWVAPSDVLVGTDTYTYRGQYNDKGFWVLTGVITPIDPSTIDESILFDDFSEWQLGPLTGLYNGGAGDDFPWESPYSVNNGDDPAPTVTRTGGLDDFFGIWLTGRVRTEWPVLFLETAATVPIQGADDGEIEEGHSLTFELQVTDSDEDTCTTKLFRYVRAVDAIWRSMDGAALVDGMSESDAGAAFVESIRHEYEDIRGDGTSYLRRARITVIVELTER